MLRGKTNPRTLTFSQEDFKRFSQQLSQSKNLDQQTLSTIMANLQNNRAAYSDPFNYNSPAGGFIQGQDFPGDNANANSLDGYNSLE